jgi:hypothetical protein
MPVRVLMITAAIAVGMVALSGGARPEPTDAGSNQFQERWGDLNCSGEIQSVDARYPLMYIVGGFVYIPEGICEDAMLFQETIVQIEGGPQVQWADVDCSGEITSIDALWLLREVAGFPAKDFPGCPVIGAMTTLSHVW